MNLWSRAEDEEIERQFTSGVRTADIKTPNRSTSAAACRLKRLGFRRPRNRWTDSEDAELERQFVDGILFDLIRIPGRSAHAVKHRIYRLALDFSKRPAGGLRKKRWTRAEDDEVERQFLAGILVREIIIADRSWRAVKNRVAWLALDRSERPEGFRARRDKASLKVPRS